MKYNTRAVISIKFTEFSETGHVHVTSTQLKNRLYQHFRSIPRVPSHNLPQKVIIDWFYPILCYIKCYNRLLSFNMLVGIIHTVLGICRSFVLVAFIFNGLNVSPFIILLIDFWVVFSFSLLWMNSLANRNFEDSYFA